MAHEIKEIELSKLWRKRQKIKAYIDGGKIICSPWRKAGGMVNRSVCILGSN